MSASALKANLDKLKPGGTVIANSDGFDKKNLRLAGYIDEADPLTDGSLANFHLHSVDVTKLTRTALEGWRRSRALKPRKPYAVSGVLAKYARAVSSASLGAVTDGPEND